jgi:putative oxygen-independent coproporphyrinogen III oxidase
VHLNAGGHVPAPQQVAASALGFYVHVPYCSARCGYCDFNTYVPGEDGHRTRQDWLAAATTEIDRAADALGSRRPVETVFVGGGTPTLLPPADLGEVLSRINDRIGLTADAEVTVEANPETLNPAVLSGLRAAGFTRISIGMQSADPRVLAVLDRQHTPGGAVRAAELAADAGFEQVSLDLIYGTPGETLSSWRDSLMAALSAGVGHISAYALKVERGTALFRRVRSGEVAGVDDDYAAAAYEIADDLLTEAGLSWYEISNWAMPGQECRHNLGYWRNADWWGIGPGAHSHLAGVRWWNERNPVAWSEALAAGRDPRAGEEELTAEQLTTELLMLGLRLPAGLSAEQIDAVATSQDWQITATRLREQGLLLDAEPLRLTRAGRLLADWVTIELLESLS